MTDDALTKKLRFSVIRGQAQPRQLVLNAPPGYLDRIGGQGVDTAPQGDAYDFVQVFVRDRAELAQWSAIALPAARPDALLWFCYPKLTGAIKSDLTRDHGWEIVRAAGLQPVTQIAIDATWSALRFRPAERVGRQGSA